MSFNCSKYLTEHTLVHPFNFARSSACEVVFHGGIDLYFSDSRRCWTSFHMLVIYPSSFVQVLFKLLPIFFFPFAQLSVRFFIFLLLQKLFSYSGYKFFTGYIFFQPVSSLFSCLRLPLKDKNCSFDWPKIIFFPLFFSLWQNLNIKAMILIIFKGIVQWH